MARKLHALIVGIEDYNQFLPLKRAVTFAEQLSTVLKERVGSSNYNLIYGQVLKNGEAKKKKIIDGFELMRRQVQESDVCLFYFAGHGAQEEPPSEFCKLAKDGIFETLVCHDSRTNGEKYDLAHQEIAYLINAIHEHKRGVHFTVITDCCHAASNDFDPLESLPDKRPGLMKRSRKEDYLGYLSYEMLHRKEVSIQLAACQAHQTARDCKFSEQFIKHLKASSSIGSYQKLINAVAAAIPAEYDQDPGIYPYNSTMKGRNFLDGFFLNRP